MIEVSPMYPSNDSKIFDYAVNCMSKAEHIPFRQPYITIYENRGIPIFCFTMPECGDRKLLRMAFGNEYGVRSRDSIATMKRKFEIGKTISLRHKSEKPYEISNIPLKPFQNTIVQGRAMLILDDLEARSDLEFYTISIGIYSPRFITKEESVDECNDCYASQ